MDDNISSVKIIFLIKLGALSVLNIRWMLQVQISGEVSQHLITVGSENTMSVITEVLGQKKVRLSVCLQNCSEWRRWKTLSSLSFWTVSDVCCVVHHLAAHLSCILSALRFRLFGKVDFLFRHFSASVISLVFTTDLISDSLTKNPFKRSLGGWNKIY